jgi:hypothetical protein
VGLKLHHAQLHTKIHTFIQLPQVILHTTQLGRRQWVLVTQLGRRRWVLVTKLWRRRQVLWWRWSKLWGRWQAGPLMCFILRVRLMHPGVH